MERGDTASQYDGIVRFMQRRHFFFQPMLIWIPVSGIHQKIRGGIIDLRQVIREFVAVCHVQRTPDGSGFRVIVCAGVNRLGCDIVAFKSVFFFCHNPFLLTNITRNRKTSGMILPGLWTEPRKRFSGPCSPPPPPHFR